MNASPTLRMALPHATTPDGGSRVTQYTLRPSHVHELAADLLIEQLEPTDYECTCPARTLLSVATERVGVVALGGAIPGRGRRRLRLGLLSVKGLLLMILEVAVKLFGFTDAVQTQRTIPDRLGACLDAAVDGRGRVWFVDAALCVYGTYPCCPWSIPRVFVRAASGRQRFNVPGAWDAVARAFASITYMTVVNTDTMCELLRKVAAEGLAGPVTVVLDNARYQRNEMVQALAAELSTAPLYLPSYSPTLNLIERL